LIERESESHLSTPSTRGTAPIVTLANGHNNLPTLSSDWHSFLLRHAPALATNFLAWLCLNFSAGATDALLRQPAYAGGEHLPAGVLPA
jgi:hypothetical protein